MSFGVLFQVGNVRSVARGLTPDAAAALVAAGRYQVQEVASHAAPAWRPPEAFAGEDYWDGHIHLIRVPREDPTLAVIPTGLVDLAKWVVERQGLQVSVHDMRRRPDHGVPDIAAIPLRSYQLEAVELAEKAGQSVLEMCPRAGKTRVGLEWVRRISLPGVWLAPTSNLVSQAVLAAEEFWGKNFAVALEGMSALDSMRDVPLVVTTVNTAAKLPQSFWDSRQLLVTDEAHHQAAVSYRKIADRTHHIFYRLALSGTYFRSGGDDLALMAVLSRIVYRVTAEDMVRMGWLVPAHIVYLPVDCERVPNRAGVPFTSGLGRDGIYEHGYRNALAAWAAATMVSRGRQTQVLVGTKAQGYAIRDRVLPYVRTDPTDDVKGCEFVSTDRPRESCRTVINRFNERRVQCLVGTSMIGEGTDLPTCDGLVFGAGGKAEVPHTQAVYRPCTKVDGKRAAVIADFADRHNHRLLEHTQERLRTYYGLPTFHTHILEKAEHFASWLDHHLAQGII